MEKSKNSFVWVEAGYNLFAEEGLEGLQIERLARIVNLNKSGFYHYFGDLDVYYEELLKRHQHRATLYFDKVLAVKSIDPDYFDVLIEFKMPTFFQMQLDRIKDKPSFRQLAEWVDQKEDVAIKQIWCQYLGVEGNSDLAMRYFDIIRGMFYERISLKNYTFQVLSNLFTETKAVLSQLSDQKAHEADKALLGLLSPTHPPPASKVV